MSFIPFREKMETAGVSESAIRCFERSYGLLNSDDTGFIPESAISPTSDLQSLDDLPELNASDAGAAKLLASCAIFKLNGGLGTSMGLEKAKSLLEVRDGLTFLDLIVKQVASFRESSGADVRFLLMNSFSTSADTLAHLSRYPELGNLRALELLQNKIPKINAETREPVQWPANPEAEWCPPGHGDLYPVLAEQIDDLIASGLEYLFVSNSDNLGATLDPRILSWFAASKRPFLMEVTARTESDRKGGHLALMDGKLVLRESAQCPDEDLPAFQDISRHRYFNTNNLWLRLDRLRDALKEAGGFLPLPVIQNRKTVDPRDKKSTPVLQLETAMGAAIACFPDSAALAVPRTRFAPVKTTADLLTLRSDAYLISPSGEVALDPKRGGIPPKVELDDNYKLVDQVEVAIAGGVPSLIDCHSLRVKGRFLFQSGVTFQGDVILSNDTDEPVALGESVISG